MGLSEKKEQDEIEKPESAFLYCGARVSKATVIIFGIGSVMVGAASLGLISKRFFMSQDYIAVIAFILSLGRALAVVLLAWFTLRWLDVRMGFKFRDWWGGADDRSKAIYLAARCFAVFVAFAICMA